MTQTGPSQNIGDTIPNNTAHAVSVTLPTWEATVGYEEGQSWVVEKMSSGYPRFVIHSIIRNLARQIEGKYARKGEQCMLFSSHAAARRCREFIKAKTNKPELVRRVFQLTTPGAKTENEKSSVIECTVVAVIYPEEDFLLAKQYWQHSGEGITSRMAEYVSKALFDEEKGPHFSRSKQDLQAQRIQRKSPSITASMRSESLSQNESVDHDFNTFIEEKYGRVLDLKFATQAKIALRRRIAGKGKAIHSDTHETAQDGRRGSKICEDDVYLYPTGMTSIFQAHQAALHICKGKKKSICFGFPYIDTLSILRKFGPGCHFYGFGDDASLDEIEKGLEAGEIDITAFFCECPSNPLLKTPNLKRVRALANKYKFLVVIDETVGNFLNISVLQYADMLVSSLTKIFSGDSNVMGGSLILNAASPMYGQLKEFFNDNYEDVLWAEDALYLERNSRDFEERSNVVNETSLAVVNLLKASPLVAKIFYPSLSESKQYYDEIKTPEGGYGGLISFVLHNPKHAPACFNAMNLHKGPSLGTNFTLACPYAILAHYQELDEVEKWGVDRNLIRISIGLEDKDELLETLQNSLDAAAAIT